MENNRNNRDKNETPEKKPKGNIWITLLITVGIVLIIGTVFNMISNSQYTKATYSDFRKEMAEGFYKNPSAAAYAMRHLPC